MREVGKNNHQEKWIKLLDAKYEQNGEIHAGDLEDILCNFDVRAFAFGTMSCELTTDSQAVTDFPATIFVAELLRSYPDAKVIFAKREKEAWARSMKSTLVHAHTDPDADKKSLMRLLREKYHRYCWNDDFSKNAAAYYDAYMDTVGKETTHLSVLKYRAADGWDPLCRFLEKTKPDVPFPRQDAWASYKSQNGSE